jgi:uncharacterized OB-fold protein
VSLVLRPQSGAIPAIRPTPLSSPFWEGCRRGELLYQYFPDSDRAQFTPAAIDRKSLSDRFEWRRSSGHGRIYSWSIVHRSPSPEFETPYAVAIVSLEEGFDMLTNIVGCRPEHVEVGLAVQVVFHAVNDELTLPYFTPLDA